MADCNGLAGVSGEGGRVCLAAWSGAGFDQGCGIQPVPTIPGLSLRAALVPTPPARPDLAAIPGGARAAGWQGVCRGDAGRRRGRGWPARWACATTGADGLAGVSAVAMGLTRLLGPVPGLSRAAGFSPVPAVPGLSRIQRWCLSPLPVPTWPLFRAVPGRRVGRGSAVATRVGGGGVAGRHGGLARPPALMAWPGCLRWQWG